MSARHARSPLNGPRTRARKRGLAARDGSWCTYCGRLFADLRHATIDHVVPLSLYRTWRAEDTVLACLSCNDRKADRLPLLIALQLTTADASADREHIESGVHGAHESAFTVGVWLRLARLASAAESADQAHDQSRSELHGHRPPVARSDPREHPTDRAFTGTVRALAVRTSRPDPTTRPEVLGEAA
ncbi:HNH endonuclease [Actinacidiphila acidipaludis]|uniref:HNH endonuclease n=1 Tax=Actinacidiphila acidipaludis TaxID=2873382 RepID=A0ABS7QFN3_9ACTN|nr:HNH endonuclease signature motif containing protein [Streptomyces acidipaludis]MBY8881976.1 HNH endonuclease [Streptomyces acidipaludis]